MTIEWKFKPCDYCSNTGKAYKTLGIAPLPGSVSSNTTVAYMAKIQWLDEPCLECGGTLKVPKLYDGDWPWPD